MNKIRIEKKEVLRYLGFGNHDANKEIENQIEECINEIQDIAAEKLVFKTFGLEISDESIKLKNASLELSGKDIARHMAGASECILLAATLGNNVDKKIRYYEKIDVTKALVFDACATACIEAVCDEFCGRVKKKYQEKGLSLTSRFSPGYGDLPLNIQKKFLGVLNAEKMIGLTASSANILIPGKSVTAIVGIADNCEATNKNKGCKACGQNLKCAYKKVDANYEN